MTKPSLRQDFLALNTIHLEHQAEKLFLHGPKIHDILVHSVEDSFQSVGKKKKIITRYRVTDTETDVSL